MYNIQIFLDDTVSAAVDTTGCVREGGVKGERERGREGTGERGEEEGRREREEEGDEENERERVRDGREVRWR